MDAEAGELNDWEVLTDPDDSGNVNSSDSAENMCGLDVIERDSEGIIRFDYFSIDSHTTYARPVSDAFLADDGSSVESDNPSWIDPGPVTETRYTSKESGEFWTDSSSDRSDDRKVGVFEVNNELGIVENAKPQVGSDVVGEIGAEGENSVRFWSDSGGLMELSGGVVEEGEVAIDDKGNNRKDEFEFSGEEKVVDHPKEAKGQGEDEKFSIEPMKSCGDEGKRGMVWWKLPLDFLKYCLFRASPVWTISLAAAMMGFVILGRRLYQMKRKSRSLQLKVTVDDKKVSQFMSRAARLNEAFSVVKRVPIIRPSLPAAGVTPWPMMSLR